MATAFASKRGGLFKTIVTRGVAGEEVNIISQYTLSAILTLRDDMSAKLRSAAKAAQDLTRGVGGVKDTRIRLNVDGLDKLKRLQSMARGMTFSPVRVGLQDNASPKLSNIKTQLTSIAGRAHNVVVNVQTRGAESLTKLKSNVGELSSGMMMGAGAGIMGVAGVGYGIADTLNTCSITVSTADVSKKFCLGS